MISKKFGAKFRVTPVSKVRRLGHSPAGAQPANVLADAAREEARLRRGEPVPPERAAILALQA